MDYYGFYTGKILDAYEFLGCQYHRDHCVFTVFAPCAKRITLIGDFNQWQEQEMSPVYNGQFWQMDVSGNLVGQRYKYRIYRNDGRAIDHCDPYGYGMELRPQNASIVRDLHAYQFKDNNWMNSRTDGRNGPVNIYELHMGSWKMKGEEEGDWFTYQEVAQELIPYLHAHHYNYVEIMPLSEHPSDNSWGYQQTGFFAPTSRYGTMDDLKAFIDVCHQNRIGVLLDFVPVHFAIDDYALANFDGTDLYEYPNGDVGNSEWGSRNFNHSRGEVQSFLQSNAMYWLKEYHVDGLRMDAISNIIYWQGDANRGVNVNAVEFVKRMNQSLKQAFPTCMLIAEDSSNYPGVTKNVDEGGLGYDYKWDMGWMNDTLAFFQTGLDYRQENYHKLTFSMSYYWNEHYLLPLSHDEVVHGKATIIQKMYGEYEGKFDQVRVLYMYMFNHPGKKLNFMGNEIAMFREWDEKKPLDWLLLAYPKHADFLDYMTRLNELYCAHPALYACDYEQIGFQWLMCNNEKNVCYAFERSDTKETILSAYNMSASAQTIVLKKPGLKNIKMLLASNDDKKPIYHLTEEGIEITLQSNTSMMALEETL